MKKNFILGFLIILIVSCQQTPDNNIYIGNKSFQSFSQVKKLMLNQIYHDHLTTFYCDCEFSSDKKITNPNGYSPKKSSKRSGRIEWEHVVPAHAFGQSFKEWREGHPECISGKGKKFKGRKCAEKVSEKFRYMQSDMHNLVPAVGEINGLRSNYSFAMIPGETRNFGKCDMEIEDKKAEPPAHVRGNIARIYMYMNSAYPGHGIVSKKNKKLFDAWDKLDPIDKWECERSKRITDLQGNQNHLVKMRCEALNLW